jgi:hypothetical protein
MLDVSRLMVAALRPGLGKDELRCVSTWPTSCAFLLGGGIEIR